jgi:hypothetical protein
MQGKYQLWHMLWLRTWEGLKRSVHIILFISSSSVDTTTRSWVSACSTIVEDSQQEGFTQCCCQQHVKPPTWRRTRDLEHSNFRHKRPPASEAMLANPAAEGGIMGEKWPRNFDESGDFHVTFGFFYMPWSTTRDRRLYFPSEGRRAEDFFARKIRRLRLGLNPRTRVPKANTLPLDHRSRLGRVKV